MVGNLPKKNTSAEKKQVQENQRNFLKEFYNWIQQSRKYESVS
jgi:hypothetical protein